MITAAMIRKYRSQIGLSQEEFARRLGYTQASISFLESGRIRVNADHEQRITERFAGSRDRPTFAQFIADEHARRREALAAAPSVGPGLITLPVYEWHDGLDLNASPHTVPACSAITVPLTSTKQVIAIRIPVMKDLTEDGEVVVCAHCSPEHLRDGDVVLAMVRGERKVTEECRWGRVTKGRGTERQGLWLHFAADKESRLPLRSERIRHVLVVVYRLAQTAAMDRLAAAQG